MLTLKDLLTFFIDVVLIFEAHRPQQLADPGYETFVLVFEILDTRVHLLVDCSCQLYLQLMWKFLHEMHGTLDLLAVVILDVLCKLIEKLSIDLIFI